MGRVAETVNSSLELAVVLRSVLDTAVEVMKAERGFLMLADEGGELRLTTTYGIDRATVEGADMQPSQTTVRHVFETGEPIVTTDAQQDPRFNVNLSVRALRLRSIVCVPLKVKARTIGVVYLDSRVAGVISDVLEDGRRIIVRTEEGERIGFVLNRATAAFTADGIGSGPRLMFHPDPDSG